MATVLNMKYWWTFRSQLTLNRAISWKNEVVLKKTKNVKKYKIFTKSVHEVLMFSSNTNEACSNTFQSAFDKYDDLEKKDRRKGI